MLRERDKEKYFRVKKVKREKMLKSGKKKTRES